MLEQPKVKSGVQAS